MQPSLTHLESSLYDSIALLDEKGTSDTVTKALIICQTVFESAHKGKVLSPDDVLQKSNKIFTSLETTKIE